MDPTRNFQQDDLPKEVTEGGRVEDSTMELWEFCKDKIQALGPQAVMDLLKQQTYLDASTLVCLSVEASESYLSEGEPLLLDFATVCKREIAFLCPPGHPERYAALSNLAVALQTRYDSSGVRADLEEAISLRREVLHSDKSAALKNLAVSLQARYEASGERGDLEEAADLHRLSLQLRPEGHPGQYSALMDLILSFESHFKAAGDRADLEAAISVHRESLNLRPTGHPDRSSSLHKLCLSLEQLYQDSQDSSVQTEITTLILEAITDVSSHLSQRLMTALNWVHPNHTMIDPPLRLHLYSESLSLLQMLITLRPGIDGQHKLLAAFPQIRTLAVDGAGEAIAAGELERAVSMLEQGRQVLLSSLQKYRTPLNELREVSPGLADELNSLSAGLDALSSTAAQWEALSYIRRDQLRLKQRKLSDLWDEILRRVRFIPGYEEYLLPPPYAKLQSAADQGPVVIVTGCKARSDALIVTKTGAPVLVPLENLTHKDLTEKRCKVPGHGFTVTTSHDETGLLESLWEKVVSPIVSRLRELGFEQGRIWWCPTSFFTTLPLHAAGKWTGEPDRDTHSSFIFSYTPTLSSLIRARMASDSRGHRAPSLLLVGHPVGHSDLNLVSVKGELDLVTRTIRETMGAVTLYGPDATREHILEAMPNHPWIHLSGHSFVDHTHPFESRFFLDQNQVITVNDIIRARLPNAELAFLLACHSAAASHSVLDESLHLASALQFAGFRSVVGTMWEMIDADGLTLSRDFYYDLIRRGSDHKQSASALHFAIESMRRRGMGPDRWAMFIHIGA